MDFSELLSPAAWAAVFLENGLDYVQLEDKFCDR